MLFFSYHFINFDVQNKNFNLTKALLFDIFECNAYLDSENEFNDIITMVLKLY